MYNAVAHERTEEFLGIGCNRRGRKEGDVEVTRGETKGSALVAADDHNDIIGSELACGPPDAGGTVIVGGDRQRPATRHGVVMLEQARRGQRRLEGVQPLVHHTIDAQVTTPGGACKLPQTRRPHTRVGIGIKGRFHMRQGAELGRQAHLGKGALDVRHPRPCADHTGAKLIRLAELEAHLLHSDAQGAV